MRAGLPRSRISPSSGCCRSARMPISVEFTAPFSPSRTWISPGWKSRLMSSLATTPGKRLVMPCSEIAGMVICTRPSPSHCFAMGPSLSRGAGEGLHHSPSPPPGERVGVRRRPDASLFRIHRGHQGADLLGVEDRLDVGLAADDVGPDLLHVGPGIVRDMLGVEQMHRIISQLDLV